MFSFWKKQKDQIAQGDVMLVPIESLPMTAEAVEHQEGERIVLAYGDVTGHAHAVHGEARYFKDTKQEHLGYLRVLGGEVTLKHEEHGHHALKKGSLYRVVKQQEFPREAAPRIVAD